MKPVDPKHGQMTKYCTRKCYIDTKVKNNKKEKRRETGYDIFDF